jgi:hypothetical protein
MKGDFYIQRTINGEKIEKPEKITGSISVDNKKLYCFENDCFKLQMDVLDIIISCDGVLLKGIEDLNGRKIYQEVWFIPG